jgi:hypothetical protein
MASTMERVPRDAMPTSVSGRGPSADSTAMIVSRMVSLPACDAAPGYRTVGNPYDTENISYEFRTT